MRRWLWAVVGAGVRLCASHLLHTKLPQVQTDLLFVLQESPEFARWMAGATPSELLLTHATPIPCQTCSKAQAHTPWFSSDLGTKMHSNFPSRTDQTSAALPQILSEGLASPPLAGTLWNRPPGDLLRDCEGAGNS